MRLLLALPVVLASASVAAAQPVEDRYGPPRQYASNTAVGPYHGRMLTWSSRAFVPQTPEPSATAVTQPAPTPAVTPRAAAPQPRQVAAPAHAPQPQAAPIEAPRPQAAATPRSASLPDSLYAAPPPAPQRMAQAAPATAKAAGSAPRMYSVHREFGLTPDAIPAPPAQGSNYVLIGASEPKADKSNDDDDRPF